MALIYSSAEREPLKKEKKNHTCEGQIHQHAGVGFYTCGVVAKYFEQGKWYCGKHAPSRVKARAAKIDKAYEAKQKRIRKENRAELNQQAENIYKEIKKSVSSDKLMNRLMAHKTEIIWAIRKHL